MSRADEDKVELTEYPLFDSFFSGVGISAIQQTTLLFASGNIGKPQYTNMQQASQIPSGGIFLATNLRLTAFFQSVADTEYTVAYGNLPAFANSTSSPARMYDCYNMLNYGAQVTLTIAQKPMVQVPWLLFPAGGGTFGSTNATGRTVVTNGLPSREAIARFVKPIKVSSLQAFTVQVQMFPFTKNSVAGGFTGSGQGGTLSYDIDPLAFLNAADGIKDSKVIMGGYISRDIN